MLFFEKDRISWWFKCKVNYYSHWTKTRSKEKPIQTFFHNTPFGNSVCFVYIPHIVEDVKNKQQNNQPLTCSFDDLIMKYWSRFFNNEYKKLKEIGSRVTCTIRYDWDEQKSLEVVQVNI